MYKVVIGVFDAGHQIFRMRKILYVVDLKEVLRHPCYYFLVFRPCYYPQQHCCDDFPKYEPQMLAPPFLFEIQGYYVLVPAKNNSNVHKQIKKVQNVSCGSLSAVLNFSVYLYS